MEHSRRSPRAAGIRSFASRAAVGAALGCLLSAGTTAARADTVEDASRLTRLSVEELANLRVVTVTGRSEATGRAAGAVHVVTSEDIRLSGATTLPDALRLAPGLQASRIDADEWAVAVRGFASRLSRSVLVTIDGRSVWTPLFAGVFWDAHDTLLPDVDQIEVSRGPGGAVYGANALNGVVSVTTRDSKDTLGGLASFGAGNAERLAALRWGGQLGSSTTYRAYGKYDRRDGTRPTTPAGYDDEWDMTQGGFRVDWRHGARDTVTASGDLYEGSAGQPITVATFVPPFSQALAGDAAFRGRNLVTRWRRSLPSAGELTVQAYYDHTTRHEPHYAEWRDTVDLDARHRLQWGGRHDAVWGLSYRASHGRFEGVPAVRILPEGRTDDIASVFANDETRLLGDRLRCTLGTKLEWNDYAGWNVQPSARVAWLAGRHTVWASATRSVRTASRLERDVVFYTSLSATQPLFAKATGSPDLEPESVAAFELGYKAHYRRLIVSASAFHNDYRDLAGNETGPPAVEPGGAGEPPRLVVPVRITNRGTGKASGAEASLLFSPTDRFRTQASYSFLRLELGGPGSASFRSNSPRHQLWVASSVAPRPGLDVSLTFRAVSGIAGHAVPAFRELDARVAYRPWPQLELAASGANLLAPRHAEFGGGFDVERAGRLQATLRF
jgi:iron complex outermembrane receptor protein